MARAWIAIFFMAVCFMGGAYVAHAGCSFGDALTVCGEKMIWDAIPDSKELGLPDAVKTQSGPTYSSKDDGYHYSRRWQGGPGGHPTVAIDVAMYCDVAHARKMVKAFGGAGKVRLSVGDIAYKTKGDLRPYYMASMGRFVVSLSVFYPDRRYVPSQEPLLRSIVEKLRSLPCSGNGGGGNEPQGDICVKKSDVEVHWSPARPLVGDQVAVDISVVPSDPGKRSYEKVTYRWWLLRHEESKSKVDFSTNGRKTSFGYSGNRFFFTPPWPGTYRIQVVVENETNNRRCGIQRSFFIKVGGTGGAQKGGQVQGGGGGGSASGGSGGGSGGAGGARSGGGAGNRLAISVKVTTPSAKRIQGRAVCFQADIAGGTQGVRLVWLLDGVRMGWTGPAPCWRNAAAGRHRVEVAASAPGAMVGDSRTFSVRKPRRRRQARVNARLVEWQWSGSPATWPGRSTWSPGQELCIVADFVGLRGNVAAEVVWRDPAGSMSARDSFSVAPSAAIGRLSCYRLSSTARTGVWNVDILLNGRIAASLGFTVIDRFSRPAPGWGEPRPRPPAGPASSSSPSGGVGGWQEVPVM